jgi:linoleoyl-CoA desaturase
VRGYFAQADRSSYADRRMYFKAAVTLLWFVGSYLALVFVATNWWQAILSSASLALATAAVGFNVQHDANHGALSKSRRVNHVVGLTLDMLGASSYVWRSKHNISHHTYTNVQGSDSDIDLGPLARLAPPQPRRRLHGLQHYYLWGLYGFLLPQWHFFHDFRCLATGRIARHRFARPRGWSLVEMIAGKLLFVGYALAVPMWLHPVGTVLLCYAFTVFLVGVVLSVVFQLAHCVEETSFPVPPPPGGRLPCAWSVHQVQTTADFAQGNRMLSWYLGGLNFQIEHHLFPRICHVHYPAIAPIVRKVCGDFDMRYVAHETLADALASHGRWIRDMGRQQAPRAPRGAPRRDPDATTGTCCRRGSRRPARTGR